MRPLKGREVQGWKNNNSKMFSHSLHRRNPVHLPGIEIRTGRIVTPMTQPAVSLTIPGKSEYAHTHTHTPTHTHTRGIVIKALWYLQKEKLIDQWINGSGWRTLK